MTSRKKLDKAAKALLGMGKAEHRSEPVPTNKDLVLTYYAEQVAGWLAEGGARNE